MKHQFFPQTNNNRYEIEAHQVLLTGNEISTILYNLEKTYGHLLDGEIPEEEFYAEILSENLENLSHREKLAVRYAKEMGENPKLLSKNETFWNELKTSFSDMEITDLTYCIAGWMGMGRVAHVLGLDQNCSIT